MLIVIVFMWYEACCPYVYLSRTQSASASVLKSKPKEAEPSKRYLHIT